MPKKLTFDEVKDAIEKSGKYILLDTEYISAYHDLTIKDFDGYLYRLNWSGISHHLQTEKSNIRPFHVDNPFTIQNIILWLKLNNINLQYVNGIYKRQGKLIFKCNVCDEIFDAQWQSIYNGDRCPFCSGHRIGNKNNLLAMFPKLCNEWDYENNIKNPSEYLFSSHSKVWWLCKNCGEKWKTSIDHRTRVNSGCPYCSPYGHNVGKTNSLEYLFPELAREWNYNENHSLLPSQVRPGSKRKVFWTCTKCGCVWKAPINNRVHQISGCQKCNYSCGELKIDTLLMNAGISYFPQWKFGDCKYINELSYDFYLPDFNAVIEYDGKYHHEVKYYNNRTKEECEKEFELIKIRDAVKDKYCQEKGINLIRIPYWEYDNIENIIKEKFYL